MTPMDRDLVTAYLQHAAATVSGRATDGTFWAWEAVDGLRCRDPLAALDLAFEAVRRSEDDATLAYIAAGPLEDLIVDHGERFIDRIEMEAAREPRFRRALRGVWGRDRMLPNVAERLERVIANEPPL
jgi:hypothetical protein